MSLALGVTEEGLDLVLGPAGLVQDESIGSLVLVSMLSDARARDEDVDFLGTNPPRRGWWADSEGDRFGSRLWLLERRVINERTLRDAESMAKDALAWLVDEGIASSVSAVATRLPQNAIGIAIDITPSAEQRFVFLWRAAGEGRFENLGIQFGWRLAA